jgi:tripartite-type tricarboxylate transporter receptor subunit TctC
VYFFLERYQRTKEGLVSTSKRRKITAETLPTVSKTRQTQRRPVEAAMLHGHPFRVNATKLLRRHFLRLAAGAAALPTVSTMSWAQTYPTRPVTMIVPFAAGGPTDVLARIITEQMKSSLGQPVIIENIGGADGSIGVGRAVRARPDGYTISLGNMGSHLLNAALYSLPYDLLFDLAPISAVATSPLVLFARKTLPARDLNELIQWLKTNDGRASAAVSTVGERLSTITFQRATGTQFAIIPYRGAAPAMQDLVAGQIDLFIDAPVQLPLVRAGNIKAFAVKSDTRLPIAPDIPTFAEMGRPAVSYSGWYGIFAPKGTPRDIVGKLNAAAVAALADPAVTSRIADLGMQLFPRQQQTPEALGALQKTNAEKWWPIIQESGIRAE